MKLKQYLIPFIFGFIGIFAFSPFSIKPLIILSYAYHKEADIILLNTCSIRDKAESKVYSELGRLNKLKEKNPNLKIGVGGCVATQEGINIKKRAPYVDDNKI